MYFFILFLCICIDTYFFLDHLEISCRQDALFPLNIKCVFPRNKDILLHNHNMSNKNRNFNAILFNSESVSKFFQLSPPMTIFFFHSPGSNEGHTQYFLIIYLISFNLEQFLRLSLVFITSMFFKSTDYFFLVEWFSIWICPHDQIWIVQFQQKHFESNAVNFSVHLTKNHKIHPFTGIDSSLHW